MINIHVQFNIEGIEVCVFDGLDLDPILEFEFISIFTKIKYLFIYIVMVKVQTNNIRCMIALSLGQKIDVQAD